MHEKKVPGKEYQVWQYRLALPHLVVLLLSSCCVNKSPARNETHADIPGIYIPGILYILYIYYIFYIYSIYILYIFYILYILPGIYYILYDTLVYITWYWYILCTRVYIMYMAI